jgi:Zn-dependent protease with chaperone function
MTSAMISTQTCPSCGREIMVDPRYSNWCDHCDWGLILPDAPWWASYGRGRVIGRLLRASQTKIAKQIQADPSVVERKNIGDICALAISASLTLVVVVFIPFLLTIGIRFWFSPITVLCFFAAACAAWLIGNPMYRPKASVRRTHLPHLANLCDQVSQNLGAPKVSHFVITPDFATAIHRSFVQRRVTLFIGLALWEACSNEQRVAVLGHEFGHLCSGHLGYRWVSSTAVGSLDRLEELLTTPPLRTSHGGHEFLARLIITLLRPIPMVLSTLLKVPMYRATQRSEYRCDIRGVRVGGTDATFQLIDLFYLRDSWDIVRAKFRNHASPADPYAAFVDVARGTPEYEMKRRRRLSELSESSIDLTHPANHRRQALIRSWPFSSPAITISVAQTAALQDEISPWRTVAQAAIKDGWTAGSGGLAV